MNYLVIGGSSGIGKETVNLLANSGHDVYATYHSQPTDDRPHVHFMPLDVMDDQYQFANLPEQLDGLVYCPGSIQLRPFNRIKDEDFVNDFRLNALGAVKTIRTVMPRLRQGENSSVVLFSTIAVQRGFSFHAQVGMSKGAVEGLTRSLAAELAPKVRVNAIAPSLTDTPLASKLLNSEAKRESHAAKNPLKKVGDPRQLAEMVAFLLSSQSSWITGQIFHVDGGFSSIQS